MFGLRIVDAVARQDWLGRLSQGAQHAVQQLFEAGGPAGQQVADVLHGTPAGHPLHPALTDIPVGAWTAALVLDALEALRGRDDHLTRDLGERIEDLAGRIGRGDEARAERTKREPS